MTSPTCPTCKVPAIWDKGYNTETAQYERTCRCCKGTVVIKRRHSIKRDERAARFIRIMQENSIIRNFDAQFKLAQEI